MRRTLRGAGLSLALVTLGVLAGGCGGADKPLKVSGTVTWAADGTPVTGATVRFIPVKEGGREADGFTGDDGRFELTSFHAGDGALPGDYKVVVTRPDPSEAVVEDPGAGESQTEKMRKWFQSKSKKGGATTSGAAKGGIPAVYSQAQTTTLRWTVDPSHTSPELKLQKSK
jgi:hypothetical protein